MTTSDAQMRAAFCAAVKQMMSIMLVPTMLDDFPEARLCTMPDADGNVRDATLSLLWEFWQDATRRASTKPLTRRDINVNDLSPGVRALHDAFIHHDMAEMTLYARDAQVAWTALGVAGKPRPVMVDQLREVLVAALGLPAGTKFGG